MSEDLPAEAGALRARLAGEWTHAREEDSAGVRVYRPRGHPLPPSRWRHRLDLRPDGTYVDHRLAADDRSARDHGRWTVGPGPAIVLTPDDPAARSRRIEVVAAGPGRIEVRVPEP